VSGGMQLHDHLNPLPARGVASVPSHFVRKYPIRDGGVMSNATVARDPSVGDYAASKSGVVRDIGGHENSKAALPGHSARPA
jgi:hypothetical protein